MKPVRRDLARQKPARRPITWVALACAGLAASLVLSSCAGGGDGSGSGSGSGNPDGPRVAAAFYPLAFVADRVAGDQAEVTNLTKPGVEPHDLEPSVRQMVSLASADLVLVLKGFQPPIDTAVEQNASGVVLDAAQVVDLEASSGPADPHFWLDPVRLGKLAEALADQLAAIDPGEASGYHSRATALVAELDELDRSFADGLAGCERHTVVVSHDAFGYLGKYGLQIEAIAGLSPDAEPTPGDLARLRSLIAAEGVTTVFSETLVSDALAKTLAEEAGVGSAVLDPIEGLSDQTEAEDYLSLMRHNLTTLKGANGC